jgi:hypothetical protein
MEESISSISRNVLLKFLVTAASPSGRYNQCLLNDYYHIYIFFQLVKVELWCFVDLLGTSTMLFQLLRLYGVK